MKMFRTAEDVLKHQLNDVYAHRKKEVYDNIRTGNDWIYDCNIYKEWCYEKLMDLEKLWVDLGVNFKKVNVISGGYAFYDGPYWLKLGVKEIWLYETDAEIRNEFNIRTRMEEGRDNGQETREEKRINRNRLEHS